jgi:hypothetical protein
MGAIDPKANPEQYTKLSVLANQTEGSTRARYKTNKNGQIVFSLDVYQKTKDGEKFVGSVINDNVSTTQMPTVVPNISKDIDQNIQNTINLVDPTSELSPVLSNDRKEILYHQDKFGRRVDPKDFRDRLKAQSQSTLSQFSDRKLASLYNNVLNPGDTDFSYDTPLSKDQKEKANLALVDYMMKQPAVTKVLGNIVESKIPKKKGAKGTELTFPQQKQLQEEKRRIKVFNKTIKEGVEGDTAIIYSLNDPNIQAIRKEDKKGNKGWFLQQKSAQGKFLNIGGEQEEGYSNIKYLSDVLGYTIDEAKDNKSKASAVDKYLNRVENINRGKEGEIKLSKPELPS